MKANSEGTLQLTLQHLVSLVSFLSRTQPVWHRQFAVKFIPELTAELLKVLSYMNKEATDANKH